MLTHPDKIYPGQVLRIPPLALETAQVVEQVAQVEQTDEDTSYNPPI